MITYLIEFFRRVVLAALLYLTPIHDVIAAVMFLIAVDFVTGVWASVKEKQKFSASKMRHTVEKVILYFIAIICAFVLQKMCESAFDFDVARYVALFIAATEVKSVYENINRVLDVKIFSKLIKLLTQKISKNENNQDKTA